LDYLFLETFGGIVDIRFSSGLSLANNPSLLKLLIFSHRPAKSVSMMEMMLKPILNILLRLQKDSDLILENLTPRQQLAILKVKWKKPGEIL
jgi:hypothetical protein